MSETCTKIQKLMKKFENDFNVHLEEMSSTLDSMFERFCPYKVGDYVQLKEDYKSTTREAGWKSFEHFLKKGSRAVVTQRDYIVNKCHTGDFVFYLQFDDDSWIDFVGEVTPRSIENRCLFCFEETKIEPFKQKLDDNIPMSMLDVEHSQRHRILAKEYRPYTMEEFIIAHNNNNNGMHRYHDTKMKIMVLDIKNETVVVVNRDGREKPRSTTYLNLCKFYEWGCGAPCGMKK